MTAMSEPLRPLTLGGLDRTALLYRRNFLLFAGVAAIPTGVIVVAAVFFEHLLHFSASAPNPQFHRTS